MSLADKIIATVASEAEAAAEALESLEMMYGPDLAYNAAQMLRGWTSLHTNIGMTLVVARLNGVPMPELKNLCDALYQSTIDVLTHHMNLVLDHADIKDVDRRSDIVRFIMRYMRRTSGAVIETLEKELRRD